MTTAGYQRVSYLLSLPSERPLRGALRNMLYGFCTAALLATVNVFLGNVAWWTVQGYLLAGLLMSFTGWGAERLWYSTVAPMLPNPFAPAAYLTRIPFWYLGGGISYTLALLLGQRFGIMGVWDTPAAALFDFGAFIGCIVQIPFQVFTIRLLRAGP
jgi:hypothetical protein